MCPGWRERLLPQPHGFEGLVMVQVGLYADRLSVLHERYGRDLTGEWHRAGLRAPRQVGEHDNTIAEVDQFDWLHAEVGKGL
jgi:hypothetical protein